ncbi:hypothetical protein D7I43_31325 [Micromonospora globbae]|uniref:Uncharacterized protein n=2 Tax=Micromonospora globbae TaxID=1894969 RepID=A0A420EQ67_9ACTN|nr:hypothetical protein D7I43_31325 [Micromonospora globbae]
MLTRTLTEVEALHERHGWDLSPELIGVFDRPTSAHPHRVHVDADLFDPSVWHAPNLADGDQTNPPAVILHRRAGHAASLPMRDVLRAWLHCDGRRCVGFAMVFEAWAGPVGPGYRHGDLAQAPASACVETRLVAAVDIDLRLYRVLRARGAQAPTVDTWAAPPPRVRHTRIATGLTRLVTLARDL